MLAVALLAWAGGVELEDLRVGEVNDLVEELTAGGAEVLHGSFAKAQREHGICI